MKKILFPMVLIAAVVSCSKSFDLSEGQQSSESKIFTAAIADDDTKTTLGDENYVNWISGDVVSINGIDYTATPGDNKTKAILTKKNSGDKDPSAISGNYYACYGASLSISGSTTTFSLPATQRYNSSYPFSVNPMYAESATTSLSFKNICSVLNNEIRK